MIKAGFSELQSRRARMAFKLEGCVLFKVSPCVSIFMIFRDESEKIGLGF